MHSKAHSPTLNRRGCDERRRAVPESADGAVRTHPARPDRPGLGIHHEHRTTTRLVWSRPHRAAPGWNSHADRRSHSRRRHAVASATPAGLYVERLLSWGKRVAISRIVSVHRARIARRRRATDAHPFAGARALREAECDGLAHL